MTYADMFFLALAIYLAIGVVTLLYGAVTRPREFFNAAWHVILLGSLSVVVGWLPFFLYFYTEERLAQRRWRKQYRAAADRAYTASQQDRTRDQSEPFVP